MTKLRATLTGATCALVAQAAFATPITVNYAGYWLETVGTNTILLAGGGSAAGINSTLFVASVSPDPFNGTTGSVVQNGVQVTGLGISNYTGIEFARRVLNPVASQLTPLSVSFANGTDTASFQSRTLVGLTPMPLVQNLAVTSGSFPTVSWALPGGTGDIDAIQIVFYDNVNNVEILNRVTLAPTATSYTLQTPVQPGFDLTINVRLIDLFDDALPVDPGNQMRMSRSFVNVVPEPSAGVLLALGLGGLAWRLRAARRG